MAAAAVVITDPLLVYDLFRCDEEHQSVITYLTDCAIKDSGQFKDIYPWRTRCENTDKCLYLAVRVPGGVPAEVPEGNKLIWCMDNGRDISIYGWMEVTLEIWYTRKIAYINELSTKQTDSVKGVGRGLIHMMEGHLRRLEIDFIKLLPLPGVIAFYKKMGYKHCLGVGKKGNLMCKVLFKKPTRAYAVHLHKVRTEQDEAEKEDIESGIEEIKSKLNEKEVILFDLLAKDDTFAMNALFFYLADDSNIESVLELLKDVHAKKGVRKSKSKSKRFCKSHVKNSPLYHKTRCVSK